MTQRFLQAVYARRPGAPKAYDASWLNLELARINAAIAHILRDTAGTPSASKEQTIDTDRLMASSADIGPPLPGGLNLIEYSQQFDVGAWAEFNGATVARDTVMAPDGTLTADTLVAKAAGGYVRSGPFSPLTATRVTISVHIKRLTTTNQTNYGIVDLTTGLNVAESGALWTGDAVTGLSNTGGGSGDYVFTDAGSGFWRVSGLTNASLDPTHIYAFYIYARSSGNTGSIYVWGAQVNAGALITYIETRAITTAFSVTGGTALNGAVTLGGTVAVRSLPSQSMLGTDASGGLIGGTPPAINPKASGVVFPFSGNYISASGTAGYDNNEMSVKALSVPADLCTQVGDRLHLRVVWAGTTGGPITGTLKFGYNGQVVVSTVTDTGTTALQVNEVWLEYIDSDQANIVEGSGVPGASSGINVAGFNWAGTQSAQLRQDAVADNHIIVYSMTIDVYPKGV